MWTVEFFDENAKPCKPSDQNSDAGIISVYKLNLNTSLQDLQEEQFKTNVEEIHLTDVCKDIVHIAI